MAWSKAQKTTAAIACKAAGIGDDQRRDMVLRNFAHAHHRGDVTSTAPKLNDADFEQFMAVVEGYADGQLPKYERGHWTASAADRWQRMRNRVKGLEATLIEHGVFSPASLGGWIRKRVCSGEARELERLGYHELLALLLGLQSFMRHKGLPDPCRESEPHVPCV